MFFRGLCLLLVLGCAYDVECQFSIPEVTLEAFQPEGFRVSIRAEKGIELFGFHGKLNSDIQEIEPGDYAEDIKTPEDGYFTYYNPSVKLKVGDVMNYWVFVQHNQLGYRKDAQTWTVKELRRQPGEGCPTSDTQVSDRMSVCADTVVFEDDFNGNAIDTNKWVWEQYFPTFPDYEFCIYKKDGDVTYLRNGQLNIQPGLIQDEELLKKTIDLSDGCTKPKRNSSECIHPLYIIQNPVVSGRITSKLRFAYGIFEVRAKLPEGDWLIPHIMLEDETNHRVLIAYSRGNVKLTSVDGTDIGGTLLFGGPVWDHVEPKRSARLTSYRSEDKPFSSGYHTYKLKWTPAQMEFFVDDIRYGTVEGDFTNTGRTGKEANKVRIVLGVSVAGVTDFPDDFKSGTNEKPWKNRKTLQVKTFFQTRDKWYPSWGEQERNLKIDYIKVTAV